jgi:hypothetical protein
MDAAEGQPNGAVAWIEMSATQRLVICVTIAVGTPICGACAE